MFYSSQQYFVLGFHDNGKYLLFFSKLGLSLKRKKLIWVLDLLDICLIRRKVLSRFPRRLQLSTKKDNAAAATCIQSHTKVHKYTLSHILLWKAIQKQNNIKNSQIFKIFLLIFPKEKLCCRFLCTSINRRNNFLESKLHGLFLKV